MHKKNFIFDLDGTIIDSKETIKLALSHALSELDIIEPIRIDDIKIGPPLERIILRVVPTADAGLVSKIKRCFIELYDAIYCTRCDLYPSAAKVLHEIFKVSDLYVVTNKRENPSNLILRHFGIKHLFSDVVGSDSRPQGFPSKAHAIEHLIKRHQIDKTTCCYVGDTPGDAAACINAKIAFIATTWGYGGKAFHDSNGLAKLTSWEDILAI